MSHDPIGHLYADPIDPKQTTMCLVQGAWMVSFSMYSLHGALGELTSVWCKDHEWSVHFQCARFMVH